MSIVRMIFCKFPEDQADKAEANWRKECAPLMIQQEGCISEQLLKCTGTPGEFISYSEWEDEESIEQYLESDDHQTIKHQNRNIEGARVTVEHYEQVS